jgi:hypothetical protein
MIDDADRRGADNLGADNLGIDNFDIDNLDIDNRETEDCNITAPPASTPDVTNGMRARRNVANRI